jgi:hypothetical protein
MVPGSQRTVVSNLSKVGRKMPAGVQPNIVLVSGSMMLTELFGCAKYEPGHPYTTNELKPASE